MGIGFRILLVKKKTIVNILADFLYKESQSKPRKELKKILTTWSEPHLEEIYFETLRKFPLEQIEQYLEAKFGSPLNEEFRDSLGISFIKHFFKH